MYAVSGTLLSPYKVANTLAVFSNPPPIPSPVKPSAEFGETILLAVARFCAPNKPINACNIPLAPSTAKLVPFFAT